MKNTRILPALVLALVAPLPACGVFGWHDALPWNWEPGGGKKFDWRTPNWRTPTVGLPLTPPAPKSIVPPPAGQPPSLLYPERKRPDATQPRRSPPAPKREPPRPEKPKPARKAPPPYMRDTRRAPSSRTLASSADATHHLVPKRRA